MLDFDVGEGGLVLRTEVHELFTSVNQAIIPHFFKGGIDAVNDVFIKGKGKIAPCTGGAESTNLEFHVATLFGNEVPDTRVEFVTIKFKASVTFFFEGAFVNDPGFETGMISTRDIPSTLAS